MKTPSVAGNYRWLVSYQVWNAMAIAIGANWVITDMILLRMEIDLALFGVVKSSMFLLPALSYWAAAGLLRRLNRDRQICLWSYFLRVLLPFGLPLAALLTRDRDTLFYVALAVLSGGYTCAMFGNNSLLALYKQALPPEKFNRGGALLTTLPSPVAALVVLPAAWLLGRASDQAFFPLLLLLQFVTLLAEAPAMISLLRIKVNEAARPEPTRLRDWGIPFRNPEFRPLFLFALLHMLWMGMVATYLVVYLLQIRNFSAGTIVSLEFVLSISATLIAPFVGRLADRFGYSLIFLVGSAAILLVGGGWVLFPFSLPFFLLFLFGIYNGNGGLLSSSMRTLQSCSSFTIAEPGNTNHYVAAVALGQSLGSFAGCLLAGPLFSIMPGEGAELFHRYFAATLLPVVTMTLFMFYRCRRLSSRYP